MDRREALAALAATAALPIRQGCSGTLVPAPAAAHTEADALALLDQIGEAYLRPGHPPDRDSG